MCLSSLWLDLLPTMCQTDQLYLLAANWTIWWRSQTTQVENLKSTGCFTAVRKISGEQRGDVLDLFVFLLYCEDSTTLNLECWKIKIMLIPCKMGKEICEMWNRNETCPTTLPWNLDTDLRSKLCWPNIHVVCIDGKLSSRPKLPAKLTFESHRARTVKFMPKRKQHVKFRAGYHAKSHKIEQSLRLLQ